MSTIRRLNKKIVIAAAAIVFIVIVLIFQQALTKPSISQSNQSNLSTTVAPAISKVGINRTFQFPIPSSDPKNPKSISYTLVQAELKDQIKVQGKTQNVGDGRNFLLIRLEVNNPSVERIKFMSSDFIRLVGEEDKKFSPDYHNGVISLDPISVKKDLVAFVVDEKIKHFTLQVGELSKEKQPVEIIFK